MRRRRSVPEEPDLRCPGWFASWGRRAGAAPRPASKLLWPLPGRRSAPRCPAPLQTMREAASPSWPVPKRRRSPTPVRSSGSVAWREGRRGASAILCRHGCARLNYDRDCGGEAAGRTDRGGGRSAGGDRRAQRELLVPAERVGRQRAADAVATLLRFFGCHTWRQLLGSRTWHEGRRTHHRGGCDRCRGAVHTREAGAHAERAPLSSQGGPAQCPPYQHHRHKGAGVPNQTWAVSASVAASGASC